MQHLSPSIQLIFPNCFVHIEVTRFLSNNFLVSLSLKLLFCFYNMGLLLLYLFLALSISFLCSLMEAVLLTTPQSFLIVKIEEGRRWAQQFLAQKEDIDRPLAAILSLNTIAHTVGAAGVGAQVVDIWGDAYLGLGSAILTILILIFTEIIPKTIGTQYWRKLGYTATFLIRCTSFAMYPFVIISSILTKKIAPDKEEISTSREEISALTSIGAEEGLFSEREHKIIQNLLKLKDVDVEQIMTPRVVVAVADENLFLSDFLKNKDYLRFSRIPVYSENDEENITGYVFRQTVFEKLAEDKYDLRLKDIKRDIVVVPNTMELYSIWEELLNKKEHIALIVDEYGGMDGIITMEDVIETLLGLEITDEKDTITDMQKYARERWKTRQKKYHLLENFPQDNETKQEA